MSAVLSWRTWDVAILDLGLPDMDGEEAARRLREMAPLALIAISGQPERLRCLSTGLFDRALPKPFRTTALRESILRSSRIGRRARRARMPEPSRRAESSRSTPPAT